MDSAAEDPEKSRFYRKYEQDKTIFNTPRSSSENCSNIVHKLFNRELYGSTSRKPNDRTRKIFERIPPRLRFCLMDIVPRSYLRGHVFMGLSQCGQFLLSFTYSCNTQVYFRESSTFTLHFLSWVPGRKVRKVHSVPLFGEDPVDSKLAISMAQWRHNPGVLVVYGIADSCSERSCLSVIGVPRLGCKKCAAYSRNEEDSMGLEHKRCLEHNFAIHTKFFCTSDSSMYEPVVQLAYSNQIIIYTDFIHILEIDFVKPDQDRTDDDNKSVIDREEINSIDLNPSTPCSDVSAAFQSPKYQNNVVQNIIADFSDLEFEPYQMSKPVKLSDVMGQELCIQASSISHNLVEEWEGPSPSIRTLISPPLRSPRRRPAESMSRFNETHRVQAEKAYEFTEEADTKCEKLSMFRKRRLADKKYEFCEDNNENIVPFRVLRSNRKYFIGNNRSTSRRAKSPPVDTVLRAHNQISRPSSPTTSSDLKTLECDHNSEAEYRVMEMLDDGSLKTVAVHDSTSKTLSDIPVSPQDPYLVHSGNSKCSKFFTRYFVESDDEITSIITDSEDDCISGYHVALHLTAHGAGLAPLQAVGSGAWERICCNLDTPPNLTLRAQQRSLDTELLCNEVCGRLCKINGKKFIYCFDWGCHVIDVCQSSGCLSGLCAMWMWASDDNESGEQCENCKDVSAGCIVHRLQYAAECLFVWDLVSGVYRTERVSMTEDASAEGVRMSGADRARELAKKLGVIAMPPGNENRLLTTVTVSGSDRARELAKKLGVIAMPPGNENRLLTTVTVSGSDRARELAKKLGVIAMPPGNENRLLTTVTVSGADRARELAKKLGVIAMPPGNENRLLTTVTVSGADRARELAKKLGVIAMPPGNENRLLTTVTGRSLRKLTDVDNCIEITKNHPDSSESESESDTTTDSD
ncbi:DDB1-and CUL4-substrate receptor 15, WD repeat domain-containing protein [Phthorimaea operculella]|nr:DDB1-and CUL4-substrate receptor 15, WD repeat domain-containing protein [Phthorimaea operculella]